MFVVVLAARLVARLLASGISVFLHRRVVFGVRSVASCMPLLSRASPKPYYYDRLGAPTSLGLIVYMRYS